MAASSFSFSSNAIAIASSPSLSSTVSMPLLSSAHSATSTATTTSMKAAKTKKAKAKAKAPKPKAKVKAKAKAADGDVEPSHHDLDDGADMASTSATKKAKREYCENSAKRRQALARSWATAPNVLSRLHTQTKTSFVMFMRTEYGDTITCASPNAVLGTLVQDILMCQASGEAFVLDEAHPEHSTVYALSAADGIKFTLPGRISSKASLVGDIAGAAASAAVPSPSIDGAIATTAAHPHQLIHDAARVVNSVSTLVSTSAPLDSLIDALELFLCHSSLRISF